jgi:glycosyltransferase involved in cell wall biosynthesis
LARILILANNDIGLYKFRKELIQDLLNKGNEVYISLPNGEFVRELEKLGCIFIDTVVDRRGINPLTDLKLLAYYFKVFRSVRPELVVTYTIKPNIFGGIVSRILKVPYAINVTGLGTAFQNEGMLKKIIIQLYKFSCKNVKVAFFENSENQNVFTNNKIVKKENTCMLNGAGVNIQEYQYTEYPNGEKIHFLFIGRVMKEKGVDEIFEAAKKIKKEYDNIVFDVIGPYEDDYQESINRLQEKKVICFHGFQQNVRPFIAKAHCFILPSYHEGMANTLLECGAMGRPLIASNIPGCKEAVNNGENGYLIKAKDSKDLYEKIKMFIKLSNNEKKTMGKKSREFIEEKFDKNKVVKKTTQMLLK